MNILITGGAGFIPSSMADRLLEDNDNTVVLVDNFLTGKEGNIPAHPNCKFISCDANNYDEIAAVFKSSTFDFVFHYAAVVGVKRTQENPILVLNDIEGIKNILELSRENGVKRVFFASSSEVYGEPVHLPQNEHTTPLNSRLPYAIVKNVGESYFRSYHQEHNLDYTIFRFFNTYGPKQSTDFVMSKFIDAALTNQDITLYGDGLQTRTFCYIDDNIEACYNAMKHDKFVNDVINVGNNKTTTIKELAEIIIRLTGSSSKITHLPNLPDGDMTRRQPDITKMRSLSDKALTPLEEGIRKILESRSAN